MTPTMSKKTLKKTTAPKSAKRPTRTQLRADDRKRGQAAQVERERPPVLRALMDEDAIIVDQFAGGGGASSGVVRALRGLGWDKDPDIAINHDPEAIAMHRANHPTTTHYIEDIWAVDPVEACGGRPVGLLWSSPTCSHFSRAKGTALDESSVKIRALADVIVKWARLVAPRIICGENVPEFLTWGPLHDTHSGGCSAERARERGLRMHTKGKNKGRPKCLDACHYCKPIKELAGTLYEAWEQSLRDLGYVVEKRVLKACDYGAPTSRKRLFFVARRDGLPVEWPRQTHAAPTDPRVISGELLPYRSAASCMNWDNPGTSIFGREKPLAEKTIARIARGIREFVLESARPFIVPVAYGDKGGTDVRVNDVDAPFPTLCGARGGHQIAVPYFVHRSNGERPEVVRPDGTIIAGQKPRIYPPQDPFGTFMAQGQKHALSVALLIKNNGGNNDRAECSMGVDVRQPLDALTCRDTKSLTVAHLVKLRGTSDAHVNASAFSVEEPMPTFSAQGNHVMAVTALLVKYGVVEKGTDLVTVTIDGEEYVLADILMRMLEPREMYNAHDFSPEYIIDRDFEGNPITKTAQTRMVGNSVPPIMAARIVEANVGMQVAA